MHPVLASCRFLLDVLRGLIAGVRVRDDLHLRPDFASKAVAQRLVSGLLRVEAYLRRVLLVMALELEPTLVDRRGPMKRPHGRKTAGRGMLAPRFDVLKDQELSHEALRTFAQLRAMKAIGPYIGPQLVDMARLYRRLDQLSAIAASPLARAKRLAFHLARSKEGPMFPPDRNTGPTGAWTLEARASFLALGHDIITRSRARPPPLPPRRRIWPMITRLA